MRRDHKFHTLTPLRALGHLLELTEQAGNVRGKGGSTSCANDSIREALTNHVKAALVRGGKRRR